MSFTYTTGVPNPPNLPSADVGNMQQNTDSIFNIWNVDHETFNSGIAGRHKQTSLINQSAPGVPGGIGGVLFANNPSAGQSWPFWQNAAAGSPFQLLGANNLSTNGYILLGGLIIQWGVVNGTHGANNVFNNGDTGTVTFSSANIAFPNNCFGVQITGIYNSNTAGIPNGAGGANYDQFTLSQTSFTWSFFSNSTKYTQFFWIAIGN